MFLKKRHHADIMAKLHNENDAITEEDEDSGLGSELVIDEERGTSEEQKTETHFEFSFDENNCPKLQQVSDYQMHTFYWEGYRWFNNSKSIDLGCHYFDISA